MAPADDKRAMGGSTPKASAVSMTMFFGWPPCPAVTALPMNLIG